MAKSFYQTVNDAIADFTKNGFDSDERLSFWLREIREAAARTMPVFNLDALLRRTLNGIFQRLIERRGILKLHPGISRFTLDRVAPRLRSELDRRIMASANLIKLNRAAAMEKTMQRFSGWATSIPMGGSKATDKSAEAKTVRKALAQLPFEERRVAIDQGHKFNSSLNEILATDGGAIAAVWHSHWRERGYDYRPDHKKRDEKVYMVRGNWAQKQGLIKVGEAGYTDQITKPGEEVYCRCQYHYVYNLRDLPEEMLTLKGKQALQKFRIDPNAPRKR